MAPVKGMRLRGTSEVRLGQHGVIGDREFLVIGEDANLVLASRAPALLQVEPDWIQDAGFRRDKRIEELDELGYMELDRRGAELLFQVLTERGTLCRCDREHRPFSGWTKTFTDPGPCAAIVDRLTFAGRSSKLAPPATGSLRAGRSGPSAANPRLAETRAGARGAGKIVTCVTCRRHGVR